MSEGLPILLMLSKILIIGDKQENSLPLREFLAAHDFRCDLLIQDFDKGPVELDKNVDADLIVVDNLDSKTDKNQHILCIADQCQKSGIPLLMIIETPFPGIDELINLDSLVFDYLTKPFDYAIVLQRVRILTQLARQKAHGKIENTEGITHKDSIMPDYIASMSHDLRNQLHGILSFSNFGIKKIEEKNATEEKLKHYYMSVKDSGTRLLNLLNNILDLAKLESGRLQFKMEERNLVTVVNGVIAELFPRLSQRGLTVRLTETEKNALVDLDAKLLGQAIKNLFHHVMSTAASDDVIDAEISKVDKTGEKSDDESSQMIMFSLKDHNASNAGPEVKKYLELALKPDDKTSDDRGLSLTISKMIIDRHQGHLWAEAAEDGGVTIHFVVPGK